MGTLSLSEKLLDKLKYVDGKRFDDKILNLLETNAVMRLRECEDYIFKFESEYGMDFKNFQKLWEEGVVTNRHSHRIERDFMEWEGFDNERKKWLKTLRDIKTDI